VRCRSSLAALLKFEDASSGSERSGLAALWLCVALVGCGGRSTLDVEAAAVGDGSEDVGADSAVAVSDDAVPSASAIEPFDASASSPALDGTLATDATLGAETSSDASTDDASELADQDAGLWCGDVQAVPECAAYQALFNSCLMSNYSVACQSGLLPIGDADVQAIQQLCLVNLQRIENACR
jgi:hypothetical protein